MSRSANQVQEQIRIALSEFEQAASSTRPPAEVLPRTVSVLVETAGALAGVVWMPDAEGKKIHPVAKAGSADSLVFTGEGAPREAVMEVTRQALAQKKVTAIGPGQQTFEQTPLHNTSQFYAPIEGAGKVLGIIHLIGPSELDPKLYREFGAFTQRAAQALGNFLSRRQSQLAEQDKASHAAMLRVIHQLLAAREPQALIADLANLSRPLLEAHRVSVVGFWKRKPQVAFSDVVEPNRRAVIVQAVELLAEETRHREMPLSFTRDQDLHGEDELLNPVLEELFGLSNAQAVAMTPVEHDGEIVAVMVVEYDTPEAAAQRAPTQQELSHQAGPILTQAVLWDRRPLRRTADAIEAVKRRPIASSIKVAAAIALLAAVVIGLLFVPVSIPVKVEGRLEPAQLAAITAPLAGYVDEVLVNTSQRVAEGDVILRFDDTDLQLEHAEVIKSIDQERVAMEAARARGERVEVRRAELRMEQNRIQKRLLERQIERATIRAPLAGIVLTERPDRLEGKTVAKGDALFELGDLSHFELICEVPEEDIGLIERRLTAGHDVPVTFLSRAWPDAPQTTVIEDLSALSPTTSAGEAGDRQVFRIIVPVELDNVSAALVLANPTGRARLDAGTGNVVYRFGRHAWQYLRMTLLF